MLEILIHGAVSSAIYAMLAVGFTLIFGVARILNLAHGSFYALGAYGAYYFTAQFKLPLFPAALLAIALVALFGILVEKVLVRPMRRSQLAVLMITLAVALVVEQALFLTFGSEYRNVPEFVSTKFNIGGVDVGGQRLLALGVSVIVIALLWIFIQRTRLGSAILAISQDPEAANYMGIPSDRIFSIVMGLSAALAATAGVLAGPFLTVQPTMAAADRQGICDRDRRRTRLDSRKHTRGADAGLRRDHRRLYHLDLVDRDRFRAGDAADAGIPARGHLRQTRSVLSRACPANESISPAPQDSSPSWPRCRSSSAVIT